MTRSQLFRSAVGGVVAGFVLFTTAIGAAAGLYGRRVERFVNQFGGHL